MPPVNGVAGYTGPTYYTYDGTSNTSTNKRGQLTQESTARGGSAILNFDYDPSGNPTTFRSNSGIGYNANNQFSSTAYTYDGNGNPTAYPLGTGSAPAAYDYENRLTALTVTTASGTQPLTYGYRADGLRAWKYVQPSRTGGGANGKGGGGTNARGPVITAGLTYFLYDGGSVVAELDSSGGLTAVHTWGMGGLLARQDTVGGGSSVYVFDPQGNVARRLDGNGTVKGSYAFDAWGAKRAGNDANPDCYCGYGGQWGYYTDSESGLTLCGHRYYDSNTGRWLTRDPIGYAGGMNLYGYVGNNAANGIDPNGTDIAGTLGQMGRFGRGELKSFGNAVYDALRSGGMTQFILPPGKIFHSCGEDEKDGAWMGDQLVILFDILSMEAAPEAAIEEAEAAVAGNCFVAGTQVAMADGSYKRIEDIKAGDEVATRSYGDKADSKEASATHKTNKTESGRVVRTFVHQDAAILRLTFADGEIIETTEGHPFYVEGKGFVLSGQLAIGNAIVTRAGPAVRLVGKERTGKRATVYNFEVAKTHTYFVGHKSGGLWVHNVSVRHFPDFDSARRDAFERAGMTNPDDVVPTKYDETGTATEFQGPGGAQVNYDCHHADMDSTLGHDKPHVGWQTSGKRSSGGAMRGNNTYDGPQGPYRGNTKDAL